MQPSPVPMLRGVVRDREDHIQQGLALYDHDRHRHHALM